MSLTDRERQELLRSCRWTDPRGVRRLIYDVHFETPINTVLFMSSLDLGDVYRLMSPEERHRVQGENKWMRILLRYCRLHLEKKGRIIRNQYGFLEYVSRNNYRVELPAWVQQMDHLEIAGPSRTFYDLYARLARFAVTFEQQRQEQEESHG